MRSTLLAGALALSAACTSTGPRDYDVFERPEAYGEFQTRVCGYVRAAPGDMSIWIDRAAWELRDDQELRRDGTMDHVVLGLVADPPETIAGMHGRNACLRGEVISCSGEASACAGSSYPYALLVMR